MTTLVLDTDRGLASLGGAPGVERDLGVPPVPVRRGLADVKRVLAALLTQETTEEGHALLPGVTSTRIVPNARAREMGLGALVVDTASTLAEQEYDAQVAALNGRRRDKGLPEVDSLDQATWGPYGESLMRLWAGLAQTDLAVVVTVHESRKEDAQGFASFEPNIKGSSSTKMLRLFDAVLYAKVKGHGDEAEFVWQTRADQARPAKTRGLALPHEVPQDFGPLLAAFREAGTPHPMVLVVGESGTGKTTALRTLADVPPAPPD